LTVRRHRAGEAFVLAGGALLVASAFLPWVRHGPGRSLHGHALVDAVIALGNNVPGLSSARLTILWYFVPAFGTLAWVAVGAFGRRPIVVRIVASGALLAAVVAAVAFGRAVGFADLGTGPVVALLGALAVVVGAFGTRP
jgi:hypothetical protein